MIPKTDTNRWAIARCRGSEPVPPQNVRSIRLGMPNASARRMHGLARMPSSCVSRPSDAINHPSAVRTETIDSAALAPVRGAPRPARRTSLALVSAVALMAFGLSLLTCVARSIPLRNDSNGDALASDPWRRTNRGWETMGNRPIMTDGRNRVPSESAAVHPTLVGLGMAVFCWGALGVCGGPRRAGRRRDGDRTARIPTKPCESTPDRTDFEVGRHQRR